MTYEIDGDWKGGWALALHTTSSVMCEDGSFENTYSDIGKALNRLKYHGEYEYIDKLVSELVSFLKTRLVTPHLSVIIPAPASKERELQPVYEISKRVADILKIQYDQNYIVKIKDTSELKSIESPDERKKALEGVFTVDQRYKDKKSVDYR